MGDDADLTERFESLFRTHSRDILGYVLRRVSDPDAAADVMAEVFVVAWRRIDDVPKGDEARLWLFGVARNVVLNHKRGIRRRNNLAQRLANAVSEFNLESVDNQYDAIGISALNEAMKLLRDDERELLQLVNWEGLEPAQAAQVLGIHGVTARTKLHKARVKLRTSLVAQGLERSSDSGHVSSDGSIPSSDAEGRVP